MTYLWHNAPMLLGMVLGCCAGCFILGYVVARFNLYERVQAEAARRKSVEDIQRAQRIKDLESELEHLLMAMRAAGIHIDEAYRARERRA